MGRTVFVSVEVSPRLAHATHDTVAMAEDLWRRIDRPNLMIKIPATPEGIPAIAECTALGINVNVTLVFSVEMYEQAAQAYVAGLRQRLDAGEPIYASASANSIFLSRIDVAIEALLHASGYGQGPAVRSLESAGLATAKLAYLAFQRIFHGPQFEEIRAKGGHVQRPLWASTGTKKPDSPDLMYVEPIVRRETINTMPPRTLQALLAHGNIKPNAVLGDPDKATAVMMSLERASIKFADVARKLQDDGLAKFSESFNSVLGTISRKQSTLV